MSALRDTDYRGQGQHHADILIHADDLLQAYES